MIKSIIIATFIRFASDELTVLTSWPYSGNSADKLRHARSVAYCRTCSAE